jgi:hypothetical protein
MRKEKKQKKVIVNAIEPSLTKKEMAKAIKLACKIDLLCAELTHVLTFLPKKKTRKKKSL